MCETRWWGDPNQYNIGHGIGKLRISKKIDFIVSVNPIIVQLRFRYFSLQSSGRNSELQL